MKEAVEKEVKEKNLNEVDAKRLLVTTIKVCQIILAYCQVRIHNFEDKYANKLLVTTIKVKQTNMFLS